VLPEPELPLLALDEDELLPELPAPEEVLPLLPLWPVVAPLEPDEEPEELDEPDGVPISAVQPFRASRETATINGRRGDMGCS
jgi:hypothetical protein